MITLKRYANRKLYDPERRRYVTLKKVEELVSRGLEVEVLDHARGMDVTGVILAQIALEREKEGKPLFPRKAYVRALTRQNGGR